MAKKLAPLPLQILDSNGAPISGAQIFTYSAGSSTKLASYTDAAGGTAHANPIVCDSSGRYVGAWLDEAVEYKILVTTAADTDPPVSPFITLDNVVGVTDNSGTQSQWLATGMTPTRLSGTQFTVSGDQTGTFIVERRVQYTDSGGTKYGYVSAVSYSSPNTTVTVIADNAGTIATGLSAVSVSILTPTSSALPRDGYSAEGTALASATTTDIAAATGDFVHITGTTTITGLGTALKAGVERVVVFDGALTLTHDGTALILPSGANITTAAGDSAIFKAEDAAGNWRCIAYTRADGTAIASVDSITLGTPQASTSGTSIDFSGIPAGTKKITVMFDGVSTNGTSNYMLQLGDSGGIETSGYLGASSFNGGDTAFTTGIGVTPTTLATTVIHGAIVLSLLDESTNTWVAQGCVGYSNAAASSFTGGSKSLTTALTQLRITTVGGSDAFDAGKINIQYGA